MASQNIYILAIESSCDDTAAAVMLNGKILSNVIASQKIHAEYGGVVPELASRAHQQNIVPVVHQALKKAGVDKSQLHAIAFYSRTWFNGFAFGRNLFCQIIGLWIKYSFNRC